MKKQGPLQDPPKKRRVFLADPHPVARQGFALLLNQEADLIVCGQAATVETALLEIESSKPDLVIVDIALPGRSGIELIKDIATRQPRLPTLVFSGLDELIYAERALRAGAKGYIMKQSSLEQLLQAVRLVLAEDVHLSEAMRRHLFQNRMSGADTNGRLSVEQLSDRELEVFRLVGEGLGTRQIATHLALSVSTVETHRTHIKSKLGAKGATDLVRRAVQWLHDQDSKP